MKHSKHAFEAWTLPGHHWKWRMRHAAVTFADRFRALPESEQENFDAVWCTSMLDLAAFVGLSGWRGPAHVYFHENQLTYPTRRDDLRDHHFAITHLTSGLAAAQSGGAAMWNSAFHRDSFLTAARKLLKKIPGSELDHAVDVIERVSAVLHPGVDIAPRKSIQKTDGPIHILWVGRWEHDKDPDAFFAALKKLKKRGAAFRLSVLGESFEQAPDCFATARRRFADEIVAWGYQPSRVDYEHVLQEADVVVSTARHEFFGLAVVEAVAAGCFPVLPRRLAYPEVFGDHPAYFYDGTPEGLAARLAQLGTDLPRTEPQTAERYRWKHAAQALDRAIENTVVERV